MFSESNFQQVAVARSWLGLLVTPIQWAAAAPGQAIDWVSESLANRNLLLEENRELKAQALILAERSQNQAAIIAENVRLRELLHAAQRTDLTYLTADLIGLNYDPYTQQLIINQGSQNGAYLGQPVVDAYGVMGQLIAVSPYTSRLLLISDPNHAVPVQINRNGLRFIAQGGGGEELFLNHVPETADIREGDLLITSGLGGRFPFGYPVAEITQIKHQRGEPFMQIIAKPKAQLNRSRYLLLLNYLALSKEKEQFKETSDGQQK